ncbi:MAG: outer membrane lipoprotein-sorting protein [Myxococcaceae bacterium]|nr:outer membrane lipoprotein-sorting protein [Myxococcaceae bacterium]
MSPKTLLAAVLVLAASARAADPTKEELVGMLKTIDDRQRNGGDYKALIYLEQKEKEKADIVREVIVYRRDESDQLMFLFTKPKSEEGKGYLRINKNLWSYDPGTGKWERTTERERIGGTNSQRRDFDESRLAEEFDPTFEANEKLGKFDVIRVSLAAKPGVDVPYPVIKLWIDPTNSNELKRQELALSGRLMRTTYYPKWNKIYSASKKGDVWFPGEIRIFDEVEKSNQTLVLFKNVDLNPLDGNMFTKAWLESKSR